MCFSSAGSWEVHHQSSGFAVEGFLAAPHLVGEMEGLVSSLRVTPIAMGSTSLGLKIELEL